jgi:NHLM bacteriocin system ABC transporter ATP-binding protein
VSTAPSPPASEEDGPLLGVDWLAEDADPKPAEAVLLPGGERMWQLEQGRLELFAVELSEEQPAARWTPLLTLEAEALFGGVGRRSERTLLVHLSPDARVRRVADEELASGELAGAASRWVNGLLSALRSERGEGDLHPLQARRGRLQVQFAELTQGGAQSLRAGALARSGTPSAWVAVERGRARVLGRERHRRLEAGELTALGNADWLLAESDCELEIMDLEALLSAGSLVDQLSRVGEELLDAVGERVRRGVERERHQLERRERHEQEALDIALDDFAAILDERVQTLRDMGESPAYLALHFIAAHLGVPLRGADAAAGRRVDVVRAIARASNLRLRPVRLAGRWWRRDVGALVGSLEPDETPVALIPGPRGYVLHDPDDGHPQRVTRRVARRLSEDARQVYRPLPRRPLTGGEIVRWSLGGLRHELTLMLLCAIGVAAVGLLVPFVTSRILGQLVPRDAGLEITQLCMLLLLGASVATLLRTVYNLAGLRIEGRLDGTVQAAVWDRLLALPARFHRRFSTGALATAVLSISESREVLSGVAFRAALELVVVIANLILICAFAPPLAAVALVALVLAAAVAAFGSRRQLRHERKAHAATERINARTFQLLSGVAKISAAAAEARAFAHWAEAFARGRRHTYDARAVQNRLAAFNAGLTLLGAAGAFFAVGVLFPGLSTATFLLFNLAFFQMLGAVVQVTATVALVLSVVPALGSLAPVLEAVPEATERLADPGVLEGEIEVGGVTFAYQPGGPPALSDVSFRVAPGEFVAIVGESGSGKSTLMRLLLAFETPEHGSVSYDGQDLAELDPLAVRRQCGVVLQDATLFAGDILSNIVGSGLYSQAEAWEALRMVGLEEEVAAMPMGIYTMLSEGGRTLSGGQRQRLLLAQAMVSRPRILLLDEATSALDNVAQAHVAESMQGLQATRIVIAHRLSTIQGADRIIVLDDGRIVQQGTYEGLIEAEGPFRALAARQLSDVTPAPDASGEGGTPAAPDGGAPEPDGGAPEPDSGAREPEHDGSEADGNEGADRPRSGRRWRFVSRRDG